MKHLILGNGAAGITAAAKLRELSRSDPVTVVSREDTAAYAKIMLPDYIGGRIGKAKLYIRDYSYYENSDIRLILGQEALYIDTSDKKVRLSGGSDEHYDSLLVAVGGVPFIPHIDGLESVSFFTINSLTDADAIIHHAAAGKNAIVMGGGLTGVEMAFALKQLGMKVFIAEREQNLLPQQLDAAAAKVMAGYLGKAGITVLAGRSVVKVEGGMAAAGLDAGLPESGTALLSDGQKLDFAMLVAAIGTKPNTACIKDTPIKYNRGILVDVCLRTSVGNIHAAGDVAEPEVSLANGYVSSYIWPNAVAQGKCAAFNMAGIRQEFSFSSSTQNIIQLRDMPFISMGMVKPPEDGYEIMTRVDAGKLAYKKLVLKDGRIRGMVLIGEISAAGLLSGAIRKGIDISAAKNRLMDDDVSLVI